MSVLKCINGIIFKKPILIHIACYINIYFTLRFASSKLWLKQLDWGPARHEGPGIWDFSKAAKIWNRQNLGDDWPRINPNESVEVKVLKGNQSNEDLNLFLVLSGLIFEVLGHWGCGLVPNISLLWFSLLHTYHLRHRHRRRVFQMVLEISTKFWISWFEFWITTIIGNSSRQ